MVGEEAEVRHVLRPGCGLVPQVFCCPLLRMFYPRIGRKCRVGYSPPTLLD